MSEPRLKRLSYRAWHRGTRELDLILGRFADGALARMDAGDLDAFETVLDAADPDLYAWIVQRAVPDKGVDAAMIERLRAHVAGGGAV